MINYGPTAMAMRWHWCISIGYDSRLYCRPVLAKNLARTLSKKSFLSGTILHHSASQLPKISGGEGRGTPPPLNPSTGDRSAIAHALRAWPPPSLGSLWRTLQRERNWQYCKRDNAIQSWTRQDTKRSLIPPWKISQLLADCLLQTVLHGCLWPRGYCGMQYTWACVLWYSISITQP